MRCLARFILLFTFCVPSLSAQTDTMPPLGGILLDADTFAAAGEPSAVTRSSRPGSKKSLRHKAGVQVFNQHCEMSCGSCAATSAAMMRRKLYCDPRCQCAVDEVFSWSFLHNQLISRHGPVNIRLKNVLDLLAAQGIPLADSFPNTPCSHARLPEGNDPQNAAGYRYWTYEPIFRAHQFIPGSAKQKETLFREQLVPKTIAWIDFNIPVIVGLLVTENFRRLTPKNCLWEAPDLLEGAKGHALLVIGFDDAAAEFEVLNSFGTGWGCGGVARIRYADFARTVQEGYVLKFNFEAGRKVHCPERRR